MDPIRVFISYSHKDRVEKDHLVSHLKVLESEDSMAAIRVETWDDSEIGLGEEWENKIHAALQESHIAILIVTANYLTSDFILKKEVKAILELHKKDLIVVPIIARACSWNKISWLAKLNVFNSGQVIWDAKLDHVDEDLAAVATQVADHAARLAATSHSLLQSHSTVAAQIQVQPERHVHVLFISNWCENCNDSAGSAGLIARWFRSLFGSSGESFNEVGPYGLLDNTRRVISDRGDEASRRLICSSEGTGVVVACFDDPQELLSFVAPAFRGLKESSTDCLRMGLHSATVELQSDTNTAGIPVKDIDLARQIMDLGCDGHVLCSAEAERRMGDKLRRDFKFTIDSFPRRELLPGKRVDVFSIHDSEIGSKREPRSKAKHGVLRTARIPKAVRALREAKLKLEFSLHVRYVKLQFKFEHSPARIRVISTKPEVADCTFEFDFEQGDDRAQTFILLAANPKDDSFFDLHTQYFANSGDLIGTDVKSVRLYRKPPPPKDLEDVFGAAIWLWDWFRFSAWYWTAALVVLICVVAYLALPAGKAPESYTLYWPDDFNEQELDTLSKRWNYNAGQIEPQDGEEVKPDPNEPKKGAILIKSPGMVVANNLGSKRFYNFTVRFKVRFVDGGKAAWVFRSQDDKRSGYVFVLQRVNNSLLLYGYYSSSETDRIDDIVRRVPVPFCCDDKDAFDITAEVSGYTIKHWIRVLNPILRDGVDLPDGHKLTDFTDEKKRFRFGNAGLLGLNDSKLKVEFWYLTPISASGSPTGSPLN